LFHPEESSSKDYWLHTLIKPNTVIPAIQMYNACWLRKMVLRAAARVQRGMAAAAVCALPAWPVALAVYAPFGFGKKVFLRQKGRRYASRRACFCRSGEAAKASLYVKASMQWLGARQSACCALLRFMAQRFKRFCKALQRVKGKGAAL
jgi:hypothetical protein